MFKSRIKSNIRMVINLRCNVKVSKSWWYQITHTNYYSSSKLFSLLYGHKKNIYHYVVKMIHIWDSSYNFVFSSLWSFKKMSKLKKNIIDHFMTFQLKSQEPDKADTAKRTDAQPCLWRGNWEATLYCLIYQTSKDGLP